MDIKIRTVNARIMHAPPRAGGETQSQVIEADDQMYYNVKFQENEIGPRVIVNDLVGSNLAKVLGVPTPETVLVYVSETFLSVNPKLSTLYPSPVKPGWQFGSKWLKNSYPPPDEYYWEGAVNLAEFPAIVVFDVASNNGDRQNAGNVLFVPEDASSGTFTVTSVDHGCCFGKFWGDSIQGKIGRWCKQTLPGIASRITGESPFSAALESAKLVTEDVAEGLVSAVPDVWGITASERIALAGFIVGQAALTGEIIERERSLFPGWWSVRDA